jgi:hypothetical protein
MTSPSSRSHDASPAPGAAGCRAGIKSSFGPKIERPPIPCSPGLNTPVVYVFFNRPDVVKQSFSAIREQRPRQLYLIADGPRRHKPDDAERCRATRALVESMLDWECEVIRDYSSVNLGAGKRISSGLASALERLGEAIVIEDDILATPEFFAFCAEMLERYRDDPTVQGISGYNPIGQYLPGERRAVPALTHLTWGWATWNRAWKAYRGNLEGWDDPAVQQQIRDYVSDPLYFDELVRAFGVVQKREVDAWDYQWIFTMLYERRHAIVSSVNLIENLGFREDATHTFEKPAFADRLETYSLPLSPLPPLGERPDPLFDQLHWRIYLGHSKIKIFFLRLLARHSRKLTAGRMKLRPVSKSP